MPAANEDAALPEKACVVLGVFGKVRQALLEPPSELNRLMDIMEYPLPKQAPGSTAQGSRPRCSAASTTATELRQRRRRHAMLAWFKSWWLARKLRNPGSRIAAIEALARAAGASAVRALQRELATTRPDALEPATASAEGLAVALLLELVATAGPEMRQQARAALDRIDPNWPASAAARSTAPWFRAALTAKDGPSRLSAIEVLGELRDREALAQLLAMLLAADDNLCMTALHALDAIDADWGQSEQARKAASSFRAALGTGDVRSRRRAVMLVNRVRDREAVGALFDLLLHPDEALAKAAGDALPALDPNWRASAAVRAALPRLADALTADEEMRQRALGVLRRLNDSQAETTVLGLLLDREANSHIEDALSALDPHWATRPVARTAFQKLSQHHSPIPSWALAVVSASGGPDDLPLVVRALTAAYDRKAPDAWYAAKDALTALAGRAAPALLQLLRTERAPFLREVALEALGKVDFSASSEALLRELSDPDKFLRGAAARALGARRYQEARVPLLNALREGEDRAVQELIAEALGRLGAVEARDRLVDLMTKETGRTTRIAAAKALLCLPLEEAAELVRLAAKRGASYLGPYWYPVAVPPEARRGPQTAAVLQAERDHSEWQRRVQGLDEDALAREMLRVIAKDDLPSHGGAFVREHSIVGLCAVSKTDLLDKGVELPLFLRRVARLGSFKDAQLVAEQWGVGELWRQR